MKAKRQHASAGRARLRFHRQRIHLAIGVAVFSGAVTSQAAWQDDATRCPSAGRAIGDGTLPVGLAAAEFGAIPEACTGSDAWVRLHGTLLVAASAPDFYGNATVAGGLRVRWALGPDWSLSLGADAATYRYVQNAVVRSSGVGYGPPTLGAARTVIASPGLALAWFARALLPFDSARRESLAFGGETGASAIASGARPGLGLAGGASLGVPLTLIDGRAHGALRLSALAEAWASGARWGGTLGAFARLQPVPELAGTSSFGLRAGTRVAMQRGFWLAAVTELPLVGGDRTDLILALFAGFTPTGGRWRGPR